MYENKGTLFFIIQSGVVPALLMLDHSAQKRLAVTLERHLDDVRLELEGVHGIMAIDGATF